MNDVGAAWGNPEAEDEKNAQSSMADIWSFMLSEWLNEMPPDETLESAADLMLEVLYDPRKWTPGQEEIMAKHTDGVVLIDAFVNLCSGGVWNVHVISRLMELLNMDWKKMADYF